MDATIGMMINVSITIHRLGDERGSPSLVRIAKGIARRPTITSATANDVMNMYITCKW